MTKVSRCMWHGDGAPLSWWKSGRSAMWMIYVYPVCRWFTLQLKRSTKILKVHMSGPMGDQAKRRTFHHVILMQYYIVMHTPHSNRFTVEFLRDSHKYSLFWTSYWQELTVNVYLLQIRKTRNRILVHDNDKRVQLFAGGDMDALEQGRRGVYLRMLTRKQW